MVSSRHDANSLHVEESVIDCSRRRHDNPRRRVRSLLAGRIRHDATLFAGTTFRRVSGAAAGHGAGCSIKTEDRLRCRQHALAMADSIGQSCGSTSRAFIHAAIYDAVLDPSGIADRA